ncbi:MAG TPA: glucose 1-dehydrogenase [Candidatus Avidesulfovibrio excrementigallinarum]|nr:glucose 1-dehydrogenase [Candidatus Avidesulfovibrio excrementigallinarum]
MDKQLQDKVAIVTGANSGIGRATAELFAREGARVVVCARRARAGQDVVDAILAEGGQAVLAVCDVAKKEDIYNAAAKAMETWGRIDVVVNNAGVALVKNVLETEDDEWDMVMNTNVKSIFHMAKAVIPQMKRQGGGVIINVASQLAMVAAPNFAAYTTSKGAILNFTRALALDHAKDNVRVNCLCPGAVGTPLLLNQFDGQDGPQGGLQDLVNMHPMGRLGRPEELAAAALFLASDASSFMTGSPLVVDGGYIAW